MTILQDYDSLRTVLKVERDKVLVTAGEKPLSNFPFMTRIEGPVNADGKRNITWYMIPRSVAEKYLIKADQKDSQTQEESAKLQSPFTRTEIYKIVEVPAMVDYLGNKQGTDAGD